MNESQGLLILLGCGIVVLGIVAITYFAFCRSGTSQSPSYVVVPQALKS